MTTIASRTVSGLNGCHPGESPYFSSGNLANKAASLGVGISVRFQPQALDVCVSRSAVIAFVALDFADLNHLGGAIRASESIARGKIVTSLFFNQIPSSLSIYRMSG